jgi:PAS domain S-box-containing protein
MAYVAAANAGFRMAFAAEQITMVWPPTGIAIACLLAGGLGWWPAVWAGALVANLGTSAPAWTAGIIASGNTLEAVAAVWCLRRLRTDFSFQRVPDALAFVLVVAIGCTTIASTVGVATLSLAGTQPWDRFSTLWFDWWLGDALGAVVVTPAILSAIDHPWSRREAVRAAAWVGATSLAAHLVFGPAFGATPHPLEYVIFPFVIGAAVRGGPTVTSWVVLAASAITVWHTVAGEGPFASADRRDGLILLQSFMGVLAGTAMLLTAAMAERRTAEREAREAAARLEHRQELLRLAQRAGGVATFEWDFRNQMAQCSAELFRMFGLPAEDGPMSAAQWAQFVHPDDREWMAAHLPQALAGTEPAAADYRIVVDGATRWLSYAGHVQRTPDGDRLLGTVVDITERKRLEGELRHHASEAEKGRDVLTLAMRGGSMGAWSRNLATNEVWWSPELEAIFGLSPGEFGRTEDGFFKLVHPEDRSAVAAAVARALDDRSDYVVDFRFRHASGEWRWMEGRGRAVYADDGTPRHLYGIGTDVTARKRAEIALRDAKRAAESANEFKDQFLATLSHELRTPLNVILGYARLLQTNVIGADKRSRAIEVIERNAVAQNRLIDDLLDMSRITAGKVRLDCAPVPAITILREAVEGIKPAADAKGIALDTDFDPFTGSVNADRMRMHQVFSNLLTNAVKFTDHGGRISVTLRRRGGRVEIVVADTGAGILPEFLPFVFEPFRQAERGFDRMHGGLGIGLAITRQLVELHGGTIRAASEGAARGSVFTVDLPCVTVAPEEGVRQRSARPQDLEASGELVTLPGVKILLVEDQADTLEMFRDALAAAGADIRTADSAGAALRVLDAWVPNLLVTDLGLPGMDGYELLRAIRSRGALGSCPAVAVSAYARPEDRMRSLAAGFQAHVAKPVDAVALVGILRTVMQPVG